jgi:hypothetical protein
VCDVPVLPSQNKVLTTAVDSHVSVPALAALAKLVLLVFLQMPSIGGPNAGPCPADAGLHAMHPLFL